MAVGFLHCGRLRERCSVHFKATLIPADSLFPFLLPFFTLSWNTALSECLERATPMEEAHRPLQSFGFMYWRQEEPQEISNTCFWGAQNGIWWAAVGGLVESPFWTRTQPKWASGIKECVRIRSKECGWSLSEGACLGSCPHSPRWLQSSLTLGKCFPHRIGRGATLSSSNSFNLKGPLLDPLTTTKS